MHCSCTFKSMAMLMRVSFRIQFCGYVCLREPILAFSIYSIDMMHLEKSISKKNGSTRLILGAHSLTISLHYCKISHEPPPHNPFSHDVRVSQINTTNWIWPRDFVYQTDGAYPAILEYKKALNSLNHASLADDLWNTLLFQYFSIKSFSFPPNSAF